jgi:hypothetical protein
MPTMPQYPPADRNPRAPAPPTGGVGEFLEEARRVCRLRHLSIHPEESYVTLCTFMAATSRASCT